MNLGWVGVVLLGVVIATGYGKVVAAWRRNVSLGGLMLVYFLVGVVYNFTEAAFFRMMTPAWIFFLFAIVSASAIREIRPSAYLLRHSGWLPLEQEQSILREGQQGYFSEDV